MAPNLKSRSGRLQLPTGVKHHLPILRGLQLVYRRPAGSQAGAWSSRWQDKALGVDKRSRLGDADDYTDADGLQVLNFQQAQDKAEEWFKVQNQRRVQEESGEVIHTGPYTVSSAWADYKADAERRAVKGIIIYDQVAKALILPVLGDIPLERLTLKRVQDWHLAISKAPRRTGKKEKVLKPGEVPEGPKVLTEDEIRARRDTANRVLTHLKAALNFALASKKTSANPVWREAKPFGKTTSVRIRVLSVEEQQKLVAACDKDFRPLVTAGLFMGARYGELAQVLVRDFDPRAETLFIQFGKAKDGYKPRHVSLSAEAVEWFSQLVAGRGGDELMFRRTNAVRTTREELKDFDGWASYDQIHAMEKAVEAAGIDDVSFHELRHTYASGLLNAGVSLTYVAEQLGHVGLRMVTRHYGHIARHEMHSAVRALSPKLGITEPTKVKELIVKKV